MRNCSAVTCGFAASSATRPHVTPRLSTRGNLLFRAYGILDMEKHRRLLGLQQLVDEDLDAMCADLAAEFSEISGSRLLVTGGGGFLGYYLVQSVLHWNERRAASAKIDVTVYDNYIRGVPEWLEALRGRPRLELRRK